MNMVVVKTREQRTASTIPGSFPWIRGQGWPDRRDPAVGDPNVALTAVDGDVADQHRSTASESAPSRRAAAGGMRKG